MLDARVIRKSIKRWPEKLNDVNRRFLPMAAKIVESDAKRRTPVDTGRLRSSIQSEVGQNEATIGTNVEYAPYIEYGTSRMGAQPYMRPAIDNNRRKLRTLWEKFFRSVYG